MATEPNQVSMASKEPNAIVAEQHALGLPPVTIQDVAIPENVRLARHALTGLHLACIYPAPPCIEQGHAWGKNPFWLSQALGWGIGRLRFAEIRGVIQKKIEEVEPALEAAKSAVGAVNKQSLDETEPKVCELWHFQPEFSNLSCLSCLSLRLRSMNKPPEHVKMAMEAVILMVKPEVSPATINWEVVRKVMRDANFIPSILEYEARLDWGSVSQPAQCPQSSNTRQLRMQSN